MGKISNAIKMLNYLNTGNKYTVKELSEKIGVSGRMIRYYKNELELSGLQIESFMGPNGGYYIVNSLPQYNIFNKYDIKLLEEAYKKLKKIDFEFCSKYLETIDKVKHLNKVDEEISKYFIDNEYFESSQLYQIVKKSIDEQGTLKILYKDLSQEWQERTIHPLQIFKYKNHNYVTAYCELRNDIRHFEFDRIMLNKK